MHVSLGASPGPARTMIDGAGRSAGLSLRRPRTGRCLVRLHWSPARGPVRAPNPGPSAAGVRVVPAAVLVCQRLEPVAQAARDRARLVGDHLLADVDGPLVVLGVVLPRQGLP